MTVIGDFIYNLIVSKEKDKSFYLKYVRYLIVAVLGLCFLMFAPSTFGRFESEGVWATYSLFQKMAISIPVISNNLFGLFNFYNLFPTLLVASIIFVFAKTKDKFLWPFAVISILLGLGALTFDWLWLTFILGIIIFLAQAYIFLKNKDYRLLVIFVAIYAVVYALMVTTEYEVGRPNYYFCLIISILTMINVLRHINFEGRGVKVFNAIVAVTLLVVAAFEVNIYTYIGEIKKEREMAILEAKESGSKIIELKEIKEPYAKFHIDPNSPNNSSYWAYKSFLDYYGLDKDVETKIVK